MLNPLKLQILLINCKKFPIPKLLRVETKILEAEVRFHRQKQWNIGLEWKGIIRQFVPDQVVSEFSNLFRRKT